MIVSGVINWLFPGKTPEGNRDKLNTVLTQKVNDMKAYTQPLADGRTGLFKTDGSLVSSFARPRDATRGATRRGLTIINL